MRRIAVLCVLSAVAGAVVAIVGFGPPGVPEPSVAQEAPRVLAQEPSWGGAARQSPLPGAAQPSSSPGGLASPVLPLALPEELTPDERVNVAIYQNCNRSVVNINTRGVQTDRLLMFEIPSEGEGSGTVLDQQGHILTNFHVVEGAQQIEVTLHDGTTYPAKLVGVDPPTDTAVVRIDAPRESLHPVVFGDSSALLVGQRVFAIGNPFGLERTLSTGIVSSLNRSLPARRTSRMIKQVIQIDAAINPGNSGGPLLDSHGRMIGMNTAIASRTGESAGVGFAIPVNTIARVVPELIRNGRVIRPEIGIGRTYQTERGLLVATLVPGGAAERAGLRGFRVVRQRRQEGPFVYEKQYVDRSTADLIVAVDGQAIRTLDDLLSLVESKRPGDTVVLGVVREGKRLDVPVKLDAPE